MARQRPTRLVMGPCMVEIDRIVIREVQYQLEVNRCRNEEITVKGNFGWAWPMWAGRPRIDCICKTKYLFEIMMLVAVVSLSLSLLRRIPTIVDVSGLSTPVFTHVQDVVR
ncbi:hypothetical protein DPMN_121350 [Dreissena polymorpha]|uniref:Uncharacterized protein n=1 Tax=Dreissena polymorpha TaxID=45954 RepID=A0A9D4GQD1_DREPO|nr:hypothetical protein DPMN_121350 [Dreissena polymorpha]